MPHAISKLNPENSIIHACEHFAFNYQFLYYKIINAETKQIIQDLHNITQHIPDLKRKYANDDLFLKKAHELQIFVLTYVMDMHYFKQHPENLASQLSARALIFYKLLNYFKKLIDESDNLSINVCSLITPYSMVPGPGSGLLLTMVRFF